MKVGAGDTAKRPILTIASGRFNQKKWCTAILRDEVILNAGALISEKRKVGGGVAEGDIKAGFGGPTTT